MNKPVNFQLASLLKQKGFANTAPHKLNRDYYNHKGELHGDVTDYIKAYVDRHDVSKLATIDAPSIADIVMWLYEEHGIWVGVDFDSKHWFYILTSMTSTADKDVAGAFDTNKEAYEAAIEHVLNNLVK